jgi:hypothetical protein
MSWREFNLVEGSVYLSIDSIESIMDDLVRGSKYKYLGSDYSRYDSATFMRFQELATGENITFFLHDESSSPESVLIPNNETD